jgi:hypothetical protein
MLIERHIAFLNRLSLPNMLTIKNKFSLPVVDELLNELAGTKYFSKLGIHAEVPSHKVAAKGQSNGIFQNPSWQFQFRVMPFSFIKAPAMFQCTMNSTLRLFRTNL